MKDLEEKHRRIVDNFSQEKHKHLEKSATFMLKQKEHEDKLRKYEVKGDFFDLFD